MSYNQSNIFNTIFTYLKLIGLWSGIVPIKRYGYYSFVFILINVVIFFILLTMNLIYTPRKIEFLIREVIFYFTDIIVATKVLMILKMRKNFLDVFNILNNEQFAGEDDHTRKIIAKDIAYFNTYYKTLLIMSNLAYALQFIFPIIFHFIFSTTLGLPMCRYYFLDEMIIKKYFSFLFIYQSFGMYCHMLYFVNVDSLMAGLMLLALTQLKVLNYKFRSLKVSNQALDAGEEKSRMRNILEHYNLILEYTGKIQHIISFTMLVQLGMSSIIICVVLCALTLPSSTETQIFMVIYLSVVMFGIFFPCWLGSQIKHESQALVFAAYQSDWIPRSQSYKRSIILFSLRANSAVQLRAGKIFELSLSTFTSILKTAYSLLMLIRNVEARENK